MIANWEDPKYREALKLAWTIGKLDYRLRNSQKAIKLAWIQAQAFSHRFYIESTRRLGKSSFLLHLMIEECLKKPGSRWCFFAPVKDGLLDYIEPIIAETLKSCPEALSPKFDRQRFMFQFPNGSSILFRGSNNQQHRVRRGLDLDGAGVDEGRDVDDLEDLIESVLTPALRSGEALRQTGWLLISSTPADTYSHDLYKYRQQAQIEGWLFLCSIEQAAQYDPDAFPPDLVAKWKRETLSPDVWQREYMCQWVIDSTRVAVQEWKDEYVKAYKKDVFYRFYHHYIGIDWGSKDFTAIIFATWDFKRAKLVVEAELTFSGTAVRSDKIADHINVTKLRLWGEDASVYRMISDSADPILINELNGHPGMNCTPVYKEKSLEAMLNQFRMLVGMEKIEVHPSCAMTVSNLRSAVWDKTRSALDKDPYNHHFDHLMALVYLTRGLVPSENPIPKDFGFDGTRVVDLNFDKKQNSLGAQALEEAYKKIHRRNNYGI